MREKRKMLPKDYIYFPAYIKHAERKGYIYLYIHDGVYIEKKRREAAFKYYLTRNSALARLGRQKNPSITHLT